ncbi:hypothetical protein [Microtetraspora malaysiensis]|uniref:hypothetical protein n=1 Tax=Microtetraspora malaysiensis TaxID=161358 RepID=UPI003D8D8878
MALDDELITALEEAAEQEKGLRQRGKTPKTATMGTRTKVNDGDYDCGGGSG